MPKPDFNTYPKPVRNRLLALRQIILDVASLTPGVGRLTETLRWGQASYLTEESASGSTIRIDGIKNEPGKYGMFFICTSGLVETFKTLYRDEMTFSGNRSIVFDVAEKLPEKALRHCISLALTHHLRKRAGNRGPKN